MNVLSVNNLKKIGREEPLFSGVTFGLNEGEKAALIGKNGTGKSTMLSTIAGMLVPDEGSVVFNREAGVSYLPQNPPFNADDTIRAHIFKSDSAKLKIINEYSRLCTSLGFLNAAEEARFEKIEREMNEGDLWNYEAQVSSILSTLGIHDLERPMKTLSGGMVKKVALAQVLVEDTKILLLDEPTNHLDIDTISWLEEYLSSTERAVLMVTHDRYFLDSVCSNIYELEKGALKLYQGNYSSYLEKKETEIEVAKNTDRRIESVLRVERDWLLRGPCARGTKAKARIRRDMELIGREKFSEDKGFSFEVKGRRLGGKVLELHGISKNYPKGNAPGAAQTEKASAQKDGARNEGVPVLRRFSYTFNKGEKIGVFGNNGSGKSTLLNIITGRLLPDEGSVVLGVNTHIAYYEQNPVFKNLNLTVLEYIEEAALNIQMNDGRSLSAAQFLCEFGFEGKIQHSPVSTLSGGERKRLYLVRLLMANPNFIVLDEPTNDFDIWTMNILEQFLTGFNGCLLTVSHDRYFMDKVADTLFILEEDGSVSGFVGKCSEYIECKKEKARRNELLEREEKKAAAKNSLQEHAENEPAKTKKLSFKEQREFEELERDIEKLESRSKELEALLSGGESDFAKIRLWNEEYQKISGDLKTKYSRWEELA